VERLWRVRRRHDHLDAMLERRSSNFEVRGSASAAVWELTFRRNDAPFLMWRYPDRESAIVEADARLQGLLRAGWTSHW
jgi:hypothetical protein